MFASTACVRLSATRLATSYLSLRAKRSNPRFCCRTPADWATLCPPPARVLEALATRPVLGTRRRTVSWRDGLLRYARNDGERALRRGDNSNVLVAGTRELPSRRSRSAPDLACAAISSIKRG